MSKLNYETLQRYNLLKAMNLIIKTMNNEEAYFTWINTVSDDATEEEFLDTAEDKELFKEVVEDFRDILEEYGSDGFYIGNEIY